MSHALVNRVLKIQTGNPTAKIILFYLAARYNPQFGCFPSQNTIARDLEISERTVIRQLQFLEDHGFIGREIERKAGKIWRTQYKLLPDTVSPSLPDIQSPDTESLPDTLTPTYLTQCQSVYIGSNSNKKRNKNKTVSNETATAPKKLKPTVEKFPAIEAIREVALRYPPKACWPALVEAVGAQPDPTKLAKCFEAWSLKGFKPTNFAWVTDWYVNGIPEYQGQVRSGKPTSDEEKDIFSPHYKMPKKIYTFTEQVELKFMCKDFLPTMFHYSLVKDNFLEKHSDRSHEVTAYESTMAFREIAERDEPNRDSVIAPVAWSQNGTQVH